MDSTPLLPAKTSSPVSVHDYRDLALEDSALDFVLQTERIASLVADVESYRTLAAEAIHALREMTLERERVRERCQRLVDELRWLRRKLLQESEAA